MAVLMLPTCSTHVGSDGTGGEVKLEYSTVAGMEGGHRYVIQTLVLVVLLATRRLTSTRSRAICMCPFSAKHHQTAAALALTVHGRGRHLKAAASNVRLSTISRGPVCGEAVARREIVGRGRR